MTRVLHVLHSLAPGGMENGIVNVATYLDPKKFEIHACCLSSLGSFASRLPCAENAFALEKKEGFSISATKNLSAAITRIRPHVIHTHNLGALLYTSLATRFGRTHPILHGEHGQPDDGPQTRKRLWQRRLFFHSARKVHTVSDSLREYFVDLGFPPKKLISIINGVNTRRFSPGNLDSAKNKLGIPSGAPVIGIVGRLITSKRHQLLIGAFEDASKKIKGMHLLIVGAGGAEENAVKKRASSSPLSSNIHLAGFQDEPAVYYRAMDLLTCPSTVEGLSNAVLEAMACGTPALAHNACGTEVIDHGKDGLLTDLSTTPLLSAAVAGAITDRTRLTSLGARARHKVEKQFSLGVMADTYADVYDDLSRARR